MESEQIYDFWDRVKKNLNGRSLKDLSDLVHVKYQNLKDQRSDNRLPRVETLFEISKVLGVSVDFLLTGNEFINNQPPDPLIEKSKKNSKLHAIFVYYADMTDDRIEATYKSLFLDTKEKRESEKSGT